MLIARFECLRCNGESRKFCLGDVCLENFNLVFSQRAVRTWPPFRSNYTQGALLLLRVVNNSISQETCKIPCGGAKIVSMIRKYHNHKLQTTPWHRKEEPLIHHETPGRQIKQAISSLFPIKMIAAILEWT